MKERNIWRKKERNEWRKKEMNEENIEMNKEWKKTGPSS